ncbi:MAG TPA: hypothetical protein P5248_12090, partial [Bacteroidales bacterium]|nr:hypothetical protein [Bacteroidales bacterium]
MKHRSNIAKHLLLLLLPGLLAWQAQAQTSLVLELDTPVIRIGEQLHARMILNGRGNPDHYRLPVFYDTLVKGIEVLEQSATDTIQHEDGYFRISRDLLITSFDSGDYLIGPLMALQVQGRDTLTIKASPVQLSVFSVTLEDSEEIRDIHGPFKVPLTWKEIYPWVLAVIALGLLLWGIRWYLRARKS